VTATLSACGSGDSPSGNAAPGTPENPLVAQAQSETSSTSPGRVNEAKATGKKKSEPDGTQQPGAVTGNGEPQAPGYQKLLERQTKHPTSRFTPCNLVTEGQARDILGAPIQQPLEAPQGPTCIYRTQTGKTFISVAVQSVDFPALKRQIRKRETVAISDRTGYCGRYGQPMLYVPLSRGRVLSIAAPCTVAKQFALKAVERLS
jgi:hypothetical protein